MLVSEVVPAGPAATAGLAAGDVLLGVDQADVTSLEGATSALAAAALAPATTLRTSRRGRERVIDVAAASSYSIAHLADLVPAPATATSAGAVLQPVLRTTLGLSAEAAVLSINGVAVQTRVQADRVLAARRPVDVLHVRDERGAWFVAIERAR